VVGTDAIPDSAIRAWALRQTTRAAMLQESAIALRRVVDARADNDSLGFLTRIVELQADGIVERLLMALAALGAPEAAGAIRRCLASTDPDVRGQAVEALDTIGDRQVARALIRMVEQDPRGGSETGETVVARLTTDPDPWIRAVALRARAEDLAMAWTRTLDQARADPDAAVRLTMGAFQEGGPSMPDTARTLDEMERMLFLRRVPLFEQLAPEDLHRVAALATERLYPAGETLVHEGDIGDELIVIVEGTVRIVRGEGADQRLIRTYRSGDHIGELAVLTDRPRAATVVAEETGVRGLVIGGAALKAILRERPDAAMAMLATLAERIAAQ
jgi:hypothetical protein